jgi:uncharacterized 2Fe-2S/4Fe-4S cluster protein (DUF4445 family)
MSQKKNLGIAIDIGTTTVQGSLIDLEGKKELAYFSALNEQLPHGHDVISRIKFCLRKPTGLEKLHKNAISSINFIIDNLLYLSKEERESISTIACVGNAALYHFTLSLPPKKLVEPPYEPEYKGLVTRKATGMGIDAAEECEFNFLPNIAGFVGSDAIGVILAADIDKSDTGVLAVDLGTNGEIVLGSKRGIYVTSTAAGPAFEGWHVSSGMRAVDGAIEAVEKKGKALDLKVIGGGEPKGISGSALVDIVAILLDKGYIRSSGRMEPDFVLRDGAKKITISQNDVRQIQLAKAAFSTGMNFLRRASRRKVSRVVITGNFGRSLNKANAKKIGIIPSDIPNSKIEVIENAALKGAQMFVKNKRLAGSRIKDILDKTRHVSLNEDKSFQREFIESMRF